MSDLLLSIIPPPGSNAPTFSFTASSIAYHTLHREITYSWEQQSTVHPVPEKEGNTSSVQQCYTKQFGGVNKDEVTLTGLLYPMHVKGGLTRIDHLRQLAESGKPMTLIVSDDTTAKKLDEYVITSITETQSAFTSAGYPSSVESHVVPQKVNFTVILSSFSTCAVIRSDGAGNELPSAG